MRVWLFVAMIVGGSFIAGCCGGAGDDGGGCLACAEETPETGSSRCTAERDAESDASDASDGATDSGSAD